MNAQSQQQVILAYLLTHNHITTLEAREKLFIMHPSGRIRELKEQGNNIITTKVRAGNTKIADYVYFGKKEVDQ